jgi:hypothetical protein
MKSKKKNQRKWESNHYQNQEEYNLSKKDKEYLSKYRKIAGEYLEDKELIELFKKNNYDEEEISKELNKIILGDDYKWKEIKNGKPVTTRSTDQIRRKQRYYKAEKSYPIYEKTENNRNESYNKRKIKGSYHKNINEFYHYVSKKPKRPFQKCIEVPSDYLPMKNNINNINNKEINNIIITENNNNNNKITPSKSASNLMKLENNIKKSFSININKIEETKNDENEKITSEEEQRRIILIKGEVFKNLKRLKTNTELKIKENKNRQKDIYKEKDSSESKTKNSYGIESDYTDIKDDKALRKKYLKIFFGNINHYSKKVKNNIKRATSKDSETSDDRQDTVKRNNRNNNITTSSNIIQKKNRPININYNHNINKNLRRVYDIDKRNGEIELESKVVNLTINSCYDNPYRDQYLKFINEKRKKNPGKIVELVIPQFNNMYMPPFPFQYPYLNQNMYMYPNTQYQPPFPIQNQHATNSQNKQNNIQQIPQYQYYGMNPNQDNNKINLQYQQQINMPFNQKINSSLNPPINSQINFQLNPQFNYNDKYIGINNPELLNPKSNTEENSEHQINNMSDN